MSKLLTTIKSLKKSQIQNKIHQRIREFKSIDTHSADQLFTELCFCILTANFNSERTIHIHGKLQSYFCTEPNASLAHKLKQSGYRFPNTRARYIVEAARQKNLLPSIIQDFDHEQRRSWLATHIKGLGYKEASHFLRNIGFDDYAIIDFHILDLLSRHHLIQTPKTLTKNKYLEIEQVLRHLALQAHLTLAELDFYLWYIETGKILK